MARWSEAAWRPVKNHGGAMTRPNPITVCLHHAVMTGSLFGVFNDSREASTHFWLARDGRAEQYVDTGIISWGGVAHNPHAISVETEGCVTPPHQEPLSEEQINAFARLLAWAHRTHGIPLKLSESVWDPGFTYHRARGGPSTGCPCDVRLRMRDEIIRRAKSGTPAPASPPAAAKAVGLALGTMRDGRFEAFRLTAETVAHRWHARDGGWVKGWEAL